LLRGAPQRGKVGQPSIPMSLDPDGAFSIGLKIGRRSADLILVDFLGQERQALHEHYPYPMPERLLAFTRDGIAKLSDALSARQRRRIAGIGISMPFELWNWAENVGAPKGDMDAWRGFDFQAELAAICDYPIFIQNDASAACAAELVFGRGAELSDFVYFFIGTFIGGGVVLNHTVYYGRTGNAGALGSMPVVEKDGTVAQLIDHASIYQLENRLRSSGIDPSPLWLQPDDWTPFQSELDGWIEAAAGHLAVAIVTACSVIDFQAAIIDGGFPAHVRASLVAAIRREVAKLDLEGIETPEVIEGMVGPGARAKGGASLPLFKRYLLDQSVLFKAMG